MFRAASILTIVATSVVAAATPLAGAERDSPEPRTVEQPRPRLVTCDGPPFKPRALRRPRGDERRSTTTARALRTFLRKHGEEVGVPRRGWLRLPRYENELQFLAGRHRPYAYLDFERQRRKWKWYASGRCWPRAYHYELEAATWRVDPDGREVTSDSTELDLLVQEDNCASGRDARGRVLRPLVHYGPRTITVTYFIRPLRGAQTCEGVPPTPVTLRLSEPIGKRGLKDGGPYRARTRR